MLSLKIPLYLYNRGRDIDEGKVPTTCPILFECYTIYYCIIHKSPFGLVGKKRNNSSNYRISVRWRHLRVRLHIILIV